MISWEDINLKIFTTVQKSLTTGNPHFKEDEIKRGISLFKKIILLKSGESELDGLSKILVPALQDALIDKKGETPSLRLLADSLEPFYKKILLVCNSQNFHEVSRLTLIPLLKKIEINNALSIQQNQGDFPQLNDGYFGLTMPPISVFVPHYNGFVKQGGSHYYSLVLIGSK